MKPKSYKESWQCCRNCKHCFTQRDYEESDTLFCEYKAKKRPFCGSVFMKEHFDLKDMKIYDKQFALWDKWSKDREVSESGVCKEWKDKYGSK